MSVLACTEDLWGRFFLKLIGQLLSFPAGLLQWLAG